jgi:cysteine desulfurase
MSDMEWRRVYADCAASAPVLPIAETNMHGFLANPNGTHQYGRVARSLLEKARADIAECIGADFPTEIAFTPSATAACRFAVNVMNIGWCSPYEHKAVRDSVESIRSFGVADGSAVAHMLVNNETGDRYDFIVKNESTHNRVFTDATAAVGQIPVNVKELGVDALAAGAHKFGGYPGIGFLYMKGGVTDEDAFPGTPPVALACAMADALKYRTEHMEEARQYLEHNVSALSINLLGIGGFSLNVPWGYDIHVPNILSVRFDGINARELLVALDALGVYASAGAACSADSDEPSRTLLASGLMKGQALSTIRLSFCPETKEDDFAYVADALRRAVVQLRQLSQ